MVWIKDSKGNQRFVPTWIWALQHRGCSQYSQYLRIFHARSFTPQQELGRNALIPTKGTFPFFPLLGWKRFPALTAPNCAQDCRNSTDPSWISMKTLKYSQPSRNSQPPGNKEFPPQILNHNLWNLDFTKGTPKSQLYIFVRRSKSHLSGFIAIPQAQKLSRLDRFSPQGLNTKKSPSPGSHGEGEKFIKISCPKISRLQLTKGRWNQKCPQFKGFSCQNPGISRKSGITAGLGWGISHGSVMAVISPDAEDDLSPDLLMSPPWEEFWSFNSLKSSSPSPILSSSTAPSCELKLSFPRLRLNPGVSKLKKKLNKYFKNI